MFCYIGTAQIESTALEDLNNEIITYDCDCEYEYNAPPPPDERWLTADLDSVIFENGNFDDSFSDKLKEKFKNASIRFAPAYTVDPHAAPLSAATPRRTITMLNCEFLNYKNIHVKAGESLRLSSKEKKRWNDANRRDALNEYSILIAQYLDEIDADAIVLTEIGTESDLKILFDFLRELNAEYKYFAAGTSRDTYTGQNVGMISKYRIKTVFDNIDDNEHFIAEPDDAVDDAPAATLSKSAVFDVYFDTSNEHSFSVPNKYTVRFILAHLISESGGAESDAKRMAQATILRRTALSSTNPNIIIAGDMNDAKGQPPILRMRGFDDVMPTFYQAGDTRYFENDDERFTYTYKGTRQMIDHFILSPALMNILKSRSGLKSQTHATPDVVSDHRAYSITINFKE